MSKRYILRTVLSFPRSVLLFMTSKYVGDAEEHAYLLYSVESS